MELYIRPGENDGTDRSGPKPAEQIRRMGVETWYDEDEDDSLVTALSRVAAEDSRRGRTMR